MIIEEKPRAVPFFLLFLIGAVAPVALIQYGVRSRYTEAGFYEPAEFVNHLHLSALLIGGGSAVVLGLVAWAMLRTILKENRHRVMRALMLFATLAMIILQLDTTERVTSVITQPLDEADIIRIAEAYSTPRDASDSSYRAEINASYSNEIFNVGVVLPNLAPDMRLQLPETYSTWCPTFGSLFAGPVSALQVEIRVGEISEQFWVSQQGCRAWYMQRRPFGQPLSYRQLLEQLQGPAQRS